MSDLARAVEHLGQTMELLGIPRMPARVFAFILADDQSAYTAAELASAIGASPAAISGAVRYLTDTRLIVRERNPAGRGDLFRVRDGDVWGTIQAARVPMLNQIVQSVTEAATLLPAGSIGRSRVEETRDYFAFIREDARSLDDRWREWQRGRAARVQ